eukprot:CAMPEP_0114672920 /NCGR_PEP_ID=MMETSP0191-20121206/43761_1 /TAXON_ID=126664 /ORGANISM="Sorites sp." /LENGTH=255 /DNA_ID=CAMNT_0001936487 /DNA_START=469 /DNA_END=1232 /DNA_ORIENTATION=+
MFEYQITRDNPDGKVKNAINIISEETNPKPQKIIPNNLNNIDMSTMGMDEINYLNQVLNPNDITIIIDPLDATKEFTEETDKDGTDMLPYVTTLVCFVKDNTPIAGIINRPFVKNEPIMWSVVATNSIHGVVPKKAEGNNAKYITVSRSHTGDAKDIVKEYLGPHESLPAGGAGYKSYLVLTGQADAYIHVTAIKVWDLCAGHALIKAAGGDITDKSGNELLYKNGKENYKFKNGLIASLDNNDIKNIANKLKDV